MVLQIKRGSNEEIDMHTKSAGRGIWTLLGGAAVACALFTGNVAAEDKIVTVAIQVSSQGLDLSQAPDARTFYTRLTNAAWVACTRGNRVDLLPADDLKGCYETALAGAIRAARRPILTQFYLETHASLEAASHGIQLPAQVAAK